MTANDRIHIIVISSVQPEPTTGGQVVLHRHLFGRPDIKVDTYGGESETLTLSAGLRRIFRRLEKTRFHRTAEDFWVVSGGRWIDASLPRHIKTDDRTVVLTVAHGDGWMAAARFARNQKLPLITFFHDWWPDIPPVHPLFQTMLEKGFRELYHRSTVAFCVSDEMRAELGDHDHAEVLYPIPAPQTLSPARSGNTNQQSLPFKLFYSGNLFEYGAMLGEVLLALEGNDRIRLEVRGANPEWSETLKQRMKGSGRWLDFMPRRELDAWLQTGDAFIVTMAFEKSLQRRMKTTFPSKLTEFVQFGKPIVIWGPEYCSAIQWARHGASALCVTDPDPFALVSAVLKLADSSDEQQRLSALARQAAEMEFNPDRIQAQFSSALGRAITLHAPA